MKKRWKALMGIAGATAIGAWFAQDTLRLLAYKPSFETTAEAGVSFKTLPTLRPQGASCLVEDTGGHLAKEMLTLETFIVVVGLGDGSMPDSQWAEFMPDLPWRKNVNRNLVYDSDCFVRSPDAPASCEGDACAIIQDVVGYPWMELSAVVSRDCFASADADCGGSSPGAGAVTLTVTRKCHYLTYRDEIYEMSDPAGNRYVMHATASGSPSLEATLPNGWKLQRVTLKEPLEVSPFGGGDNCFHNVMRDNLGQGYHQYVYAGPSYP